MKKKLIRRLRSGRGESLIESLAALLVITLSALMLAGAIVSGARLNRTVEDTVTLALQQDTLPASGSDGTCVCTLPSGFAGDGSGSRTVSIPITTYEDDWGFSYYGKK